MTQTLPLPDLLLGTRVDADLIPTLHAHLQAYAQ